MSTVFFLIFFLTQAWRLTHLNFSCSYSKPQWDTFLCGLRVFTFKSLKAIKKHPTPLKLNWFIESVNWILSSCTCPLVSRLELTYTGETREYKINSNMSVTWYKWYLNTSVFLCHRGVFQSFKKRLAHLEEHVGTKSSFFLFFALLSMKFQS